MKLLLDAGNTRLKWGLHEEGAWLAQGVLDHDAVDSLPGTWRDRPPPMQAIGVNVAGSAVAERIASVLGPGLPLRWNLSAAVQCGVRNGYREPSRLGADRWAALIGARHLHRGASLVVMAGTATTVDLLAEDGQFLGGVILPGFDLMRRSLARDTAQLPFSAGHYAPFPRSTEDAIYSGCSDAQAGAIERLFGRLAGRPDALCLLSGGAARVLAGRLDLPVREVDNLVLEGLAQIAAEAANIST